MKRVLKWAALIAWTVVAFGVGVEWASITPQQAYQNGYVHGINVCMQRTTKEPVGH